ncbi:MAG: alpha/beta fold hydrolase, partial [Acidobacteriota bacterium]
MYRALVASLLVLGPLAAGAGETKFSLTIDNIMRGANLVGYEPAQILWSGDSAKIYFRWKKAADPVAAPFDTYVVNRDGTGLRKLTDDEVRLVPPAAAAVNEDRTLSVFSQDGDLIVVENATGKRRQVSKTSDAETDPRFLPGGRRISFQRGGNLFTLSLDNGELEQVTDIRSTAASETPKGTEAQEYLKKEQQEMFEVVRERLKYKEEAEARQKKLAARKPFHLAARQSIGQMQLSPDGKYVLALVTEVPNGSKNSNVPNWITDSSFPEDIPGRSRVGDSLSHRHLAVIDVTTGEVKSVDHGEAGNPAARIEDGGNCSGSGGAFGQTQPVYFSPDGTKAVFGARSQDNKACWYFALDIAGAKARVIASEKDAAWIGGPGGGAGWLGDNQTFYFTSERDGFNHLYEVPYEGGEPRQMTAGKFEIDRVILSRDRSEFYLTSNEGSFHERHLWSMSVNGGARTRITKLPGSHVTELSPDEKFVADIYSYTNKPPELYVQPNQTLAAAAKMTSSPAPEFAEYPWLDTPIVEIPARDGAKLPAHLYKPPSFRKGGPAVIFVHGSGYLQDITKGWSVSYSHEYLFHHFLMEHGYLVVEVDYRGSKGYGRAWRTAVYRHMGGTDLNDEVDAAKWLVAEHGADPKRIGIYGGSYGGFITLMAMFTQPDVFAAGAALRPVSDWAYYNQQYSGNILNQPQTDAEAYRRSSPIYYANGLKGHLLICHGMVDTNVQFVDTVRLTQKLIELRKE